MHSFTFTQDVVAEIRHERYHHPHPRVQQKMEVLWLKTHGFTHEDIAQIADVSRRTVQRYLDDFAEGGLDQLRRIPWKGRSNDLAEHQASLEDYFLENPPATARQAQAAIEEQTGVRRGLTQVRAFLKKSWVALAQGGDDPRQGRPRDTSGVSGNRAPAAS